VPVDRVIAKLLCEISLVAEQMEEDCKNVLVFGASTKDSTSLRSKIIEGLRKWQSSQRSGHFLEIHTAEDYILPIVDSFNLLQMENVLGEAVDAIIVCPESSGSFAELGAFANSKILLPKLFVINNIKYKRQKSFVNNGPIKHIKQENGKQHVVWIDPGFTSHIEEAIKKIAKKIIDDSPAHSSNDFNLFFLRQWFLLTLYIVDNATKEDMVEFLRRSSLEDAGTRFEIAVHSLFKTGEIERKGPVFHLNSSGIEQVRLSVSRFQPKARRKVDLLRTQALNLYKRRESTA